MKYFITVFGDRLEAEEAYTALEKVGMSMNQIFIVGKGYKTLTELGFIEPSKKRRKNAIAMAVWLVPFGFFGGFTFDAITDLNTFAWAGTPLNHIIGGFLGAIGGAMGSFFVGGGFGLPGDDDESSPLYNRLDVGKYLVMIKGTDSEIKQANLILRRYNPEILTQL